MRIAFISDTHGHKVALPDADVLVHCGDALLHGTEKEFLNFIRWIDRAAKHEYILYVPGNHDFYVQENPEKAIRLAESIDMTLLIDRAVVIKDTKFYGSPWQPWFHDWAYNFASWDDGSEARSKWAEIPQDTDVLITHGPPRDMRDETEEGERVGCPHLCDRVLAVKPKIHAFGHIHEGYGSTREGETWYVNASTCNRRYAPVNAPITVDL